MEYIGNKAHKKIRDHYLKSNPSRSWGPFLRSYEGDDNKRISYVSLATILRKIGMELNDVVPIEWPDEQFRELAGLCEVLNEDLLSTISNDLKRFVPKKFRDVKTPNPSERLLIIWKTRDPKHRQKQNSSLETEPRYMIQSGTSFPIEKLVEISKFLHISMHWILFYDGPVYSRNPMIDLILDDFSFVSKEVKDGFLCSVKDLAKVVEKEGK